MKPNKLALLAVGSVVVLGGLLPIWQAVRTQSTGYAKPTLIIDAGHGGFDGGAESASGLIEKDLNLLIAQNLQDFCTLCGMETIMVRESDTDVGDPSLSSSARKQDDIYSRLDLFEETEDAWVLSIHQNEYPDASVFGAQMFYGVQNPQSEHFAAVLQERFWALDPENDRQIKPGPESVYLLQHTTKPMVLAECGFMSNPEEAEKLASFDYQQKVAFTLLCGVCDAWKMEENQDFEE